MYTEIWSPLTFLRLWMATGSVVQRDGSRSGSTGTILLAEKFDDSQIELTETNLKRDIRRVKLKLQAGGLTEDAIVNP